jgi:DNA-binding transcriptional LysR family regulator
MDRFESMSAFVAVASTGSFSAAARRLGAPLASVSRRVSELEEQLGVQLLMRSTRKITLTAAGQQFFAASKTILDRLNEAERAASGEYQTPRGKLVMVAPIVFGRQHVVPIVAEFLRAFQDVEIELRMTSRFLNLADAGVDLAVQLGQSALEGGRTGSLVGGVARIVAASPSYLADRGRPAHPHDLARHDCVRYAVGDDEWGGWRFRIDGAVQTVVVPGRLTVMSAEAAVEAALAGAGLVRAGAHALAQPIIDGQLERVLIGFEPEPFPVAIVVPSERPYPLKLETLLDFLTPRLEARLRLLEEDVGAGAFA